MEIIKRPRLMDLLLDAMKAHLGLLLERFQTWWLQNKSKWSKL